MSPETKQQAMDFVDKTIESCQDCRDICEESIVHCIKTGGELSQMDVLGVLMDCRDISALSVRFMLRGSPYFRHLAPTFIEVCEKCAEMCDTVSGDEFLSVCAKSCRRCADNVRQIA
jgi:hypothetical protein